MTKETIDEIITRHSKELEELQSADEGSIPASQQEPTPNEKKPDADTSKEEEGYIEYEKKTPQSDRLSYSDSEIEVIEEEII